MFERHDNVWVDAHPNIRRIWLSDKSAQPAKAGGGYRSSSQYKLKFHDRLFHGSNQSSGGQIARLMIGYYHETACCGILICIDCLIWVEAHEER